MKSEDKIIWSRIGLSTFLIVSFLLSVSHEITAQVKITDGSVLTIDNNSLLELESTNKGLLIPRMAINNLNLPAPLTAPVPQGMLIFSSGGSVQDGFYYWNGTKWIYFNIPEIPIAKTVTATLLKSETFVLASGDITLTLPVVTIADNGLSITVKNIGTYLNLITVAGNSGATIDGIVNSNLTRWRGQTYTAWNGNWVTKNKETRTDNLLDVSATGSFTTIAEVVGFLNVHMSGPTVVRLGGGTFQITATQAINLPYPVTFEGLSFGETTINAAAGVSGNPLFTCLTECYFKMISFNAYSSSSGNDAIRLTGSGIYYEIKDTYFNGFNRAIVSTNNNDIWIFESDFDNCAGSGLECAAGATSGGSLKISESDFTQCAKGINLLSGITENVSIENCTFYNTTAGTDIGILYTPATFTNFPSLVIINNAWNNQGTYISGFDFTRSDGRDANAFLENNAGMEDENPHCKINVNNNTSTTTITNAGTFYKANWINTSVITTKMTMANNRITYQQVNKRDGWAIITGNIAVNNTNRVITIAVYKNGSSTGTRYGDTDLRITIANQPFQFSTVIYVPDLSKNDYLELFATSANSGDIVTFQDIQWFTTTQ